MYTVVDTASLIYAGKMKSDCSDARIIYDGIETPSQVTGCNTATSKIWLQTDLAASASKRGFYLYYGNAVAAAPDYSAQSSLQWNNNSFIMNTGKITSTFNPAGGIISQIKNNSNNQDLMSGLTRGLGYVFSNNSAFWYIFLNDEMDDIISSDRRWTDC